MRITVDCPKCGCEHAFETDADELSLEVHIADSDFECSCGATFAIVCYAEIVKE